MPSFPSCRPISKTSLDEKTLFQPGIMMRMILYRTDSYCITHYLWRRAVIQIQKDDQAISCPLDLLFRTGLCTKCCILHKVPSLQSCAESLCKAGHVDVAKKKYFWLKEVSVVARGMSSAKGQKSENIRPLPPIPASAT